MADDLKLPRDLCNCWDSMPCWRESSDLTLKVFESAGELNQTKTEIKSECGWIECEIESAPQTTSSP